MADIHPAKLYVRVARGRNGDKVAANVRPSYLPLSETRDGVDTPLPTAYFALVLRIPDEVYHRAEQVAATVDIDAKDGQVIVQALVEGEERPDV